jgi:mannose-6-phosphate isomerase-like protein (cupin superfamily)
MNNLNLKPMYKPDPHAISSIAGSRIIELNRHTHLNGSLTAVENSPLFPFKVKRVFYLYDVPADSERGGHSHYEAEELIVALSGSFDVVLDDGHEKIRYNLNRPYRALYIPTGLWRTLDNFSSGSVCLVLTSEKYSEADYVRDYDVFKKLTKEKIF